MRLIDADALWERHCESCTAEVREGCKTDPVCATLMWVDEAPTIDPVKHGKWELVTMTLVTDYFMCSECGTVVRMNFISDFKTPPVTYNYCPYCGVKMDK